MKLHDAIQEAYTRQWSMVNTFTAQFDFGPIYNNVISFTNDTSLNLNIISFTTPDFTNSPIEEFIGNRWFIHNGRDELYKYSVTFRDSDQMSLYKSFYKMYRVQNENYFDDVAFTVSITKDADYYDEEDKIFIRFEKSLIENISNVSFNNTTENQIAEFTVNFKCTSPIIP